MDDISSLDRIDRLFAEQAAAHQRMRASCGGDLLQIADLLAARLATGHKILLFGNGGSAADAQHVAAELVGRFARERAGWPAMALTTDTSILTAIGNDYGFDRVFARQIEAHAVSGDVAVGISTSGNSPNVLEALKAARRLGVATIGFTGGSGGKMADICDRMFIAPTAETPRIQELHIAAWHIICELIEIKLTS